MNRSDIPLPRRAGFAQTINIAAWERFGDLENARSSALLELVHVPGRADEQRPIDPRERGQRLLFEVELGEVVERPAGLDQGDQPVGVRDVNLAAGINRRGPVLSFPQARRPNHFAGVGFDLSRKNFQTMRSSSLSQNLNLPMVSMLMLKPKVKEIEKSKTNLISLSNIPTEV